MRQELRDQEPSSSCRARPIEGSDVLALGALMLADHRNTVDDEGETEADAVAEVEATLAGYWALDS
jgi:hypothetical protein